MSKFILVLLFGCLFNLSCNYYASKKVSENLEINSTKDKVRENLEISPSEDKFENNEIPDELFEKFIADLNTNDFNFIVSEEDLKILKKNLKLELNDLNNDGVDEFFLVIDHHHWCGAGSNCSYWIYQKTDSGYQLLLEDKVIGILDTFSNGYKDLLSEVKMGMCKDKKNESAYNLYITPYKFDGEKYVAGEFFKECRKFTRKKLF